MTFNGWAKKFYRCLVGPTHNWREQIFSVLTRLTLVIAVPAAFVSILTSIFTWTIHDIDFLIIVFLAWLLLTFNQKLSFRFRVGLG
jgi:hypothetical protein